MQAIKQENAALLKQKQQNDQRTLPWASNTWTRSIRSVTLWNSTANAYVKANPNKYEIVNTPNYWKGIDY